jgi:hypothetical protein
MATPKEYADRYWNSGHPLEYFIEEAIKDERERCAKLVESQNPCCSQPYDEWHGVCHTSDAALIREG